MSEDQKGGLVARKIPERAAKETPAPKPATPYTPASRFISSNYSSPGSTFGKEDDAIILELNPRFIKAGIGGESCPQCRIDFTPDNARRVGDYRIWIPGHVKQSEHLATWGEGYELWRNDLTNVDLGLLADRLERSVREAYNKYLLIDAGNARLVLVIPSLLPHPVLSTILKTLFERWIYSTITLLPVPTMAVVGAGLRSGLVIDIGWEETVVSTIYEFREVSSFRTTRAMKTLTRNLAELLNKSLGEAEKNSSTSLSLATVEEVVHRIAAECLVGSATDEPIEPIQDSKVITIDVPLAGIGQTVNVISKDFAAVIMNTFTSENDDAYPDDHEIPVDLLMFRALLALPVDVRSLCVSRIVFTGAGSDIPTLPAALLHKFNHRLRTESWNNIRSKRLNSAKNGLAELSQNRTDQPDAKHDQTSYMEKELTEERYIREKARSSLPEVKGVVRCVETLGSWEGASLVTSLKIKGFVEVQRERFLSHGLSSASRDKDTSVVPQPRTSSLAMRNKGVSEKTSWTLAGWA